MTFYLEPRSGVPPYLQLVRQVEHALRLGMLTPGDQLPTVREVVSGLAINPNTVFKAYRELEREGLVASRPGQGTFVLKGLAGPSPADHQVLRAKLERWLIEARSAGLDKPSIEALVAVCLRAESREDIA
ncbi:MAG: GntR family transcriptional regulator [Candidatus Dormibacteraeota bacterium]|nr:GntR family transcriptional regulator [Candidatus Dormibacteraeota bacterium]